MNTCRDFASCGALCRWVNSQSFHYIHGDYSGQFSGRTIDMGQIQVLKQSVSISTQEKDYAPKLGCRPCATKSAEGPILHSGLDLSERSLCHAHADTANPALWTESPSILTIVITHGLGLEEHGRTVKVPRFAVGRAVGDASLQRFP